ncbi:MAG: hypothetical protein WED85_06905 [Dehalococcoidia bacterium]
MSILNKFTLDMNAGEDHLSHYRVTLFLAGNFHHPVLIKRRPVIRRGRFEPDTKLG